MAPPPGEGQPKGPGLFMSFVVPMIFVGLIFYFVLIKPQKKQHQEVQKMRDNLEEGANIITTGGIHGTVKKVKDDIVTLQIADNVRIKINRSSIGKIKE
ncbi:MAG: preprotein translocase subunit YajC [Nitrospinaceae bacterium]|nr:preprotein translocase subunit YajC [Nitrospinaceae bacterium]NIR54380.1 preprotein translocase subunit YajC [Nitrospinaceae bacterium]NIS84793.1 preprotein translocase subunit YajC [Nitrospinaceae bacterium]NIT81599.1 preprotein translocase subunit YajC [Nitrospinaceae bacterium]NIU43881.1 preprotein translocase subunit YajC [Nitrospinaceae bacterium]